eukprot:2504538-Prymnesium_polylepis.2
MVVRPCEERRDEAAVVGVVRRHEEEDERVRHGGEEAADDSDGDRTIKVVIGYGRADAEGGDDVDLRPHACTVEKSARRKHSWRLWAF